MTNEEGRAVCQDGAGLKAEVLRCVVRLILITGIKREMADLVGTWVGETHPARYKYERRQSLGLRKVAHFHLVRTSTAKRRARTRDSVSKTRVRIVTSGRRGVSVANTKLARRAASV